MVLKFKNPKTDDLKKVMIYGLDGTGKSTFAVKYCQEHNLNPVVIDIDDTNRTQHYIEGRVLQLSFSTDIATFNNIRDAITDIKNDNRFDTIIIDGVTSLLEMLVSNAKGMAKYSDRAMRFQKILQALLGSGKNLIFIGQIDMEVIYTEEVQSSKAVIKVNSIVNEKYLCKHDLKKNTFTVETVKNRTIGEIKHNVDFVEICKNLKDKVLDAHQKVTKSTMKSCLVKEIKKGNIDESLRPDLIKYINEKCPD